VGVAFRPDRMYDLATQYKGRPFLE
jgi:hypothetical protein